MTAEIIKLVPKPRPPLEYTLEIKHNGGNKTYLLSGVQPQTPDEWLAIALDMQEYAKALMNIAKRQLGVDEHDDLPDPSGE